MSSDTLLQMPCIIWTCAVGPVMSPSVVFISFAKKVAINFCWFFSQLLRILFSLKLWNKKRGSSCSFTRKGVISLPSLVWGKSLTFCTRTRSCARANDAKIVRSRDAQCKTKESPQGDSSHLHCVSLLRTIYGVIRARSRTRTLKTRRIWLSSVSRKMAIAH